MRKLRSSSLQSYIKLVQIQIQKTSTFIKHNHRTDIHLPLLLLPSVYGHTYGEAVALQETPDVHHHCMTASLKNELRIKESKHHQHACRSDTEVLLCLHALGPAEQPANNIHVRKQFTEQRRLSIVLTCAECYLGSTMTLTFRRRKISSSLRFAGALPLTPTATQYFGPLHSRQQSQCACLRLVLVQWHPLLAVLSRLVDLPLLFPPISNDSAHRAGAITFELNYIDYITIFFLTRFISRKFIIKSFDFVRLEVKHSHFFTTNCVGCGRAKKQKNALLFALATDIYGCNMT